MTPADPIDSSLPRAQPPADAQNHTVVQGGDAVRQWVAKTGGPSQRRLGQWRGRTDAWCDGASAHIRAHPIRSAAIAASTGMLLALLLRALKR